MARSAGQWFNDRGGIAGRKVTFLSHDDAYTPSKAIEQVRRVVEEDEVACLRDALGTASNPAFMKYVNRKKGPRLFVGSGADRFQDPKNFPCALSWQPSYRVEAQIFANYVLRDKPDTKILILYQKDEFGNDCLNGFEDVFKHRFDKRVKPVTYEIAERGIARIVVVSAVSGRIGA